MTVETVSGEILGSVAALGLVVASLGYEEYGEPRPSSACGTARSDAVLWQLAGDNRSSTLSSVAPHAAVVASLWCLLIWGRELNTIALVLFKAAISLGILPIVFARGQRYHTVPRWILICIGVAHLPFTGVFLGSARWQLLDWIGIGLLTTHAASVSYGGKSKRAETAYVLSILNVGLLLFYPLLHLQE